MGSSLFLEGYSEKWLNYNLHYRLVQSAAPGIRTCVWGRNTRKQLTALPTTSPVPGTSTQPSRLDGIPWGSHALGTCAEELCAVDP